MKYVRIFETGTKKLKPGNHIVKVQLSVDGQGQIMVYNKDSSVFYQESASKEMIKKMRGEFKKFFYANATKNKIDILNPAPHQDW